MTPKLTSAQRRFLAIIYPEGTVAKGTTTGAELLRRGFVELTQWRDRYQITPAGAAAIEQYPESKWPMPTVKARARFR